MNIPKRIFKDINNFKKSNLEESGIFCNFCENNLFIVNIMIIGPKDTPYENGFYFFRLTFPTNYPFSPPVVKYYTQGHNIRFNPNLYVNGKVCVSILNTWDGPGWTSCCTLNSILLSLQSLLNENPIQNEPGWDYIDINDPRAIAYNSIIKYCNLKIAVIDNIKNPYKYFVCFDKIMRNYLEKNMSYYLSVLGQLKQLYSTKQIIKSHIYNLFIETDYEYCRKNLKMLINMCMKPATNITKGFVPVSAPVPVPVSVPNPKRKAPNKNSKFFDIGYEKISENDGKLYIVSLTKTNRKRWKLKI